MALEGATAAIVGQTRLRINKHKPTEPIRLHHRVPRTTIAYPFEHLYDTINLSAL